MRHHKGLYCLSKYVFTGPELLKIACILTFMSRINFMLSCVGHEKSFITSRPGILNEKGLKHHFSQDLEDMSQIIFIVKR